MGSRGIEPRSAGHPSFSQVLPMQKSCPEGHFSQVFPKEKAAGASCTAWLCYDPALLITLHSPSCVVLLGAVFPNECANIIKSVAFAAFLAMAVPNPKALQKRISAFASALWKLFRMPKQLFPKAIPSSFHNILYAHLNI